MSPLEASPKMKGMLRLLKYLEENEDRSVSQEKSGHKKGREEFPQDTKDAGIRRRCQKQNDPRRPAEDLEKDEEDKLELKPERK